MFTVKGERVKLLLLHERTPRQKGERSFEEREKIKIILTFSTDYSHCKTVKHA